MRVNRLHGAICGGSRAALGAQRSILCTSHWAGHCTMSNKRLAMCATSKPESVAVSRVISRPAPLAYSRAGDEVRYP